MTGEKTKSEGRLSILNTQKKDKNINIENPELEERYQDIIVTIKKPPPKKKLKRMTQEIMQKIKWKEKMSQQLEKQKAHQLKL